MSEEGGVTRKVELKEFQESEFLRSIHGYVLPDNLTKTISDDGLVIGYAVGKPNIRKLVEMTIKIMNSKKK